MDFQLAKTTTEGNMLFFINMLVPEQQYPAVVKGVAKGRNCLLVYCFSEIDTQNFSTQCLAEMFECSFHLFVIRVSDMG